MLIRKIFEHLLSQTTAKSAGKIRLFSKIDVCVSCQGIISQFALARPKIIIDIVTGSKSANRIFQTKIKPSNIN